MGGDRRDDLLDLMRIAWLDDRQVRHAAEHRDVLGRLMARSVAGGQAPQGARDGHVEAFRGYRGAASAAIAWAQGAGVVGCPGAASDAIIAEVVRREAPFWPLCPCSVSLAGRVYFERVMRASRHRGSGWPSAIRPARRAGRGCF